MNLELLASCTGHLCAGDQRTSFAALAELGTRLSGHFQKGDSVLLWTDKVDQIVAATAASLSCCTDIYIAHRTIPKEDITDLLSRFGIRWLMDGDQVHALEGARKTGTGSIFVMTSGTTRAPKVARHKPESLFATHRRTEKSQHARWLLTYPPTSFAGLQVVFSAVIGGADLVVPGERTMQSFAKSAEQHSVTHISGTPTFWRAFLMLVTPAKLRDLQQITVGGEAVDQPTLDRLSTAFPASRITHIYASTEAGVGFSVTDGRAGIPASWLETGVGDVRLRVRNDVLEIQTPRMLKRYESGEPTPIDREGWLSTGDLVSVEAGRLNFRGRSDRRMNVGGFKVSPEEVEAVLLECEGVAEVQVSGVPSPISGQVLAAAVVPKPGLNPEDVKKQVQRLAYGRLEPFKVPRIVRIVESVAVADSGKKVR
ncbi:MAG TPA: fatty acid--CoA ligase family protein [Candidatus Dormibacteraeota bacterium]|nr:fatty acid--CoA ligase family protein [Candidatus Dormibacteraeota bacterium]